MSSVHNQTPEFEQRNNFLWFLLGLHSIALTIREELAPAPSPRQPGTDEVPAEWPRGSLLR
jgi:hypothetical protein